MKARDKLKKNSAQQGKQILATLQQVSEDYEEQYQYDDWTSDVYYGQGYDHEGYYYDEYHGTEEQDEDDEEEEPDEPECRERE